MTALDAMKQAIAAMTECMGYMEAPTSVQPYVQTSIAIAALRAAIAQMERAEPVAWSLETDYYYYIAEKHKADLSHCDGRENGTVWFNEKNFLAFCRELHTHPAAPSKELADQIAGNKLMVENYEQQIKQLKDRLGE